VHEWPLRSRDASKANAFLATVEWAERIFERMPVRMRGYFEWPRAIMQTVRGEIEALHAGTCREVRFRVLGSR